MATSMRGLTQFIADIRGARIRENEERRINKEMANIRKKFKEGNLDGYQKKKYVAKIVFTYILGYSVDIGHMEAVNLISSAKYSEKQIGYLAVTLLMNEGSDLLRLVINSIKKDLAENSEISNCLALHAIANVGGNEMADALSEDVHRLLISPTSQNFVKKKAALTLLRLYRKHPEVIPAKEWALRIVSIMDDPDLGVVLSVASLVTALAQDHRDAYSVCYQKAVNRLVKLVVDREFGSTYAYYKVPAPWLQVKLLRLLQYYPAPDDQAIRDALQKVLYTIMSEAKGGPRNVQQSNAQNAILFEAIGLAIHLDASSSLVDSATVLLARFILSKETNVRYLGLDTMAHLAAQADSLDAIKKQQQTIVLSLRDKDISVRRRALDLLYSMCDGNNAESIVDELLRYLKVADYALREEMVLKIAILTEKYANSYTWYIDTMLELISTAGEHVGEEVWYRVVQIITNTEDLREYAVRSVFEYIQAPICHESLIKVAGYVLGEYGHLLSNEQGFSPAEQFQALYSKSQFCGTVTRALLLSTYIKWVNVFPEIKAQLITVFERYQKVLDSELQQRACEYLALARRSEEDEILQNVCEEMPIFPPRESALLGRLSKKHGDTEDKRIWVHGGKELNKDRAALLDQQDTQGVHGRRAPRSSSVRNPDLLDFNPSAIQTSPSDGNYDISIVPLLAGPHIDKWYDRLCWNNEGVLFEDSQLQVGIKSEFHGHLGRIAVFMGNKITTPLTSFTTSISSDPDLLSITFEKIPSNSVDPRSQSQQILQVECRKPYSVVPRMTISFLAGSHQAIAIQLPVPLTKFFHAVQLNQTDFFERWKVIGGPPREAQEIFPISMDRSGDLDFVSYRNAISGSGFGLSEGIDPNPSNLVAAGILHTSQEGKVGCLLRFEPNKETKQCRLTVRSTAEEVAANVLQLLKRILLLN